MDDVKVSTESNDIQQAPAVGATAPDLPPSHPLAVRRAAMMTASIGVAHALLLISGAVLLKTQTPGIGASDQEIIDFYGNPEKRRIAVFAGLYLIPFAGIAFIWFFVALR